MRSGKGERTAPAAAPAPECTADFEFDTSFDTKKRVWTSRIDFPDKEPVKFFERPSDPNHSHNNNEEVRHLLETSFLCCR
jgi:hypothetical protein